METLLEKSLNKHDFPEKERRELAKEGEAMKDVVKRAKRKNKDIMLY